MLKTIHGFFVILVLFLSFEARSEVVITNLRQDDTELTLSTVRAIFFMRMTQWKNDKPITVFVLRSQNPIHARFCEKILGVFPYQLQRSWDRLVFSGTGQSPLVVDTPDEMKIRVSETAGSIGYINEDALDGTVKAITFY